MITPPDNLGNDVLQSQSSVLVTGGTGFIGAYIIRDLVNSGYSVKAIRRSKNFPSFIDDTVFSNVIWIDCDILDYSGLQEAMENVEYVIHCAAIVSFDQQHRENMMHTNIEGTINMVNAALEKNIRKFIYVSSVAAIGRNTNGEMVNEDIKWQEDKNNTGYAISKHYSEMEVWRGIAEGLPAIIVNPSTVIGYGNWNNSSTALFKKVFEGLPWYTNGATGFVDVEDVSRIIVQLLGWEIHSERFIINGDNWTFRKLMDTIADGFNKKRPAREATPFLAGIAWRMEKLSSFFTGKKMLLTRESAAVAQKITTFDNSKILAALPGLTFTPLDETIRKACKKYVAFQNSR